MFVTARGWEDLSNLLTVYHEENIPVTKDVIYEYLSQEDVAEEFSAYLDLYFKYEDEYPIDEILSGSAPSVIYERLLKAGFDERITVVELIITALLNRVGKYYSKTDTADADGIKSSVAAALENVFTFIEEAFTSGSEMVLFVTELSISTDAVLFLMESPSEKYLKYSKEYLTGSRRGELLSEIGSF